MFRITTFAAILLSLCASTAFSAINTVRIGSFGDTPLVWKSDKAKLLVAPGKDRINESRTMLSISGLNRGDTVISGPVAVKEFSFYRLNFDMKCQNSKGEPVRVRIRYLNNLDNSDMGTPVVFTADPSGDGNWQKVSAEVRTPWKSSRLEIIISRPGTVKAGDSGATVTMTSPVLEQIPCYTLGGQYDLNPVPKSLEKMRGVHPRLYLTKESIADLKIKITTTDKSQWENLLANADRILKRTPAVYDPKDEQEQLFMRNVGNFIPTLAFAYVLSGDKKYFDAAKIWAMNACSYPTWGILDCRNGGLASGHQLFGLALFYDWCYNDLDDDTRMIIRETFLTRGENTFRHAAEGNIVSDRAMYALRPWPEWDEAWLQNHLWINSCGLAAAGMAIFDEDPAGIALPWIGFTLNRYAHAFAIFDKDGASHEGPGYWTYGLEWMLKFSYLAQTLLDVDFFSDSPIPGLTPDLAGLDYEGGSWFRNTADYYLYMTLPHNHWKNSQSVNVDYGDSPRELWYGPSYMLRYLSSHYKNGHAQWLADLVIEQKVNGNVSPWLDVIWNNSDVKPVPPDDLPTFKLFSDIGVVSTRTGWDGDESMLVFKCGPYIGKRAIENMTYCPSSAHHVHPDTGNFMLFGAGEWLIRDDGYMAKFAGQHNTLLIDGKGQMGEGGDAFDGSMLHALKREPTLTVAEQSSRLDHLIGNATQSYPDESGLKNFTRHILFLKPDVLLILDEISAASEHNFELRFHPEQMKADRDGNAFITRGDLASMRLDVLTPENTALSTEVMDIILRGDLTHKEKINTVRLIKKASSWRNAVAITWSDIKAAPKKVSVEKAGDVWTFTAGGERVKFDWKSGKAE